MCNTKAKKKQGFLPKPTLHTVTQQCMPSRFNQHADRQHTINL
jgi:hypothetical protein